MQDGSDLRGLLEQAVHEQRCEAILLSGGLDTSIVASLAAAHGSPRLRLAVTVVVGDDAPDLPYATELAARLGLEHVVLRRSLSDLWATLPELVRALGTFDGMYLRNDVVVFEGLRELARRGVSACFVGDAADELFAGYSFMFDRPADEIAATVRRFASSMHFNGPQLGRSLGIDVRSPYLDPPVIAHAVSLPGAELVMDHGGQRHGKAPLRRAFASLLGERHAYRRKDPIEIGSGATALRGYATARVDDFEAEAARVRASDGVRVRDAERMAYYRIYRDVFGAPPRPDPAQPKACPDCHARGPEGTYCRVCGAYPI
jgi:asparagine synthase (glutamine-hydrolysing)